jgi:GNAT superfamily N-acetyltransferase
MSESTPAGLRVESYREGDLGALFALFAEWGDADVVDDLEAFRLSLEDSLSRGRMSILMAWEGIELLGYLQAAMVRELSIPPYWEVYQLLVSERARGRGVGRALMSRVQELAAKDGAKAIKLSSQVHRSKAHVFYEGLGMEYFKVSKFYRKTLG